MTMARRGISTRPVAMIGGVWHHRYLVGQLARREVLGRYRGSVIGLAWSFLNPLLMLAVYTVFFSVAFKARWGGATVAQGDFAIVLFAGLIVHGIFAESVTRAPALMTQHINFVKKVVFPLEILPCVSVVASLFHAGISLFILLAAQLVLQHTLVWTAVFFPLVIAPFVLLLVGVSWMLAAIGVYVRDIVHVMGVFTSVMLFLSPVFYPVASLPEALQPWIMLNPLTFVIEQVRAVVLLGQLPDWQGLAVYAGVSAVVAWCGFFVFQTMRRGFADVL